MQYSYVSCRHPLVRRQTKETNQPAVAQATAGFVMPGPAEYGSDLLKYKNQDPGDACQRPGAWPIP